MTTIGVFAIILNNAGEVLCVQKNYPPFSWTIPGGLLGDYESPEEGLIREVREETGYHIVIENFIGVYSAPFKSDLVLSYACEIVSREKWKPNDDISKVNFFSIYNLPSSMRNNTLIRILDAFENHNFGISRVFVPNKHSAESEY